MSLIKEVDIGDNQIRNYAKSKGYAYETYRGDIDADNIFSYSPKERREYGIFTTTEKEIASKYSRDKEPRKFYVRAPKILNLMNDTMENMNWVQKWSESFDEWIDRGSGEQTDAWTVLSSGGMFDYEGDWSSERWMDIQATSKSEGYDAVILPDYDSSFGVFPSFVIFDEHNIKLAESEVPLEQRFNRTVDDIRY
jgi:hypothetical protein